MREIRYSEKASKQLKKIARGDKKSASLILNTIERYVKNPGGRFDVKVLEEIMEILSSYGSATIEYFLTKHTRSCSSMK